MYKIQKWRENTLLLSQTVKFEMTSKKSFDIVRMNKAINLYLYSWVQWTQILLNTPRSALLSFE